MKVHDNFICYIRGKNEFDRQWEERRGKKDKKGERMLLLNDPKSEEKIHLWLEVS